MQIIKMEGWRVKPGLVIMTSDRTLVLYFNAKAPGVVPATDCIIRIIGTVFSAS
jgi:hypothetical protein